MRYHLILGFHNVLLRFLVEFLSIFDRVLLAPTLPCPDRLGTPRVLDFFPQVCRGLTGAILVYHYRL